MEVIIMKEAFKFGFGLMMGVFAANVLGTFVNERILKKEETKENESSDLNENEEA